MNHRIRRSGGSFLHFRLWAQIVLSMRILAIDGNSLSHRAFHAYGPHDERSKAMSNSQGEPIYAVYGFFLLMWKIMQRTRPEGLVVGFDDHKFSKRKEMWPQYKAQRISKGPELYLQMDVIREVLKELSFFVCVPEGLEADDVMAAVAQQGGQAGHEVIIATSDRDSFALIDDNVTVFRLLNGMENSQYVTPEVLQKSYGIEPKQYLEFAALRGDPSDNLVGVAGIGEKTAAKILQTFPSIRYALEHPQEAQSKLGARVFSKLSEGVESFKLNVAIMSSQCPFKIDMEKCTININGAGDVFAKYELPSLVRRYETLLK